MEIPDETLQRLNAINDVLAETYRLGKIATNVSVQWELTRSETILQNTVPELREILKSTGSTASAHHYIDERINQERGRVKAIARLVEEQGPDAEMP